MTGIKHLVQCHCILPQFKNVKNPIFHKFIVFSIIDDSDTVITKHAVCDNCSAVHKVYDVCKSEIITGRDEIKSLLTKKDFKFSLPLDLFDLLNEYEKDLYDYEYCQFLIDNKIYDQTLVLSRDDIEDNIQGKVLKFLENGRFRIESYSHNNSF